MIFTLKADAEFEASSIDDVFDKLANYFKSLYIGDRIESPFTGGSITIEPLKKKI